MGLTLLALVLTAAYLRTNTLWTSAGIHGAGIFVLTGMAAGVSGPASILAFALNGAVTLAPHRPGRATVGQKHSMTVTDAEEGPSPCALRRRTRMSLA